MSLFGVPGSVLIKTTLLKSLQRRCSQHPGLALIKISTDRQLDAQTIEFPGAYTLLEKPMVTLVLQAKLPGAKKFPAWLVLFLENVLPLQQ